MGKGTMSDTLGTDHVELVLDESARQLLLGARMERDRAQEAAKSLETSLRLMTKQYERVNNALIRQNTRVWGLERELEALKTRYDAALAGPDGDRAPQIMEYIQRLSEAAHGLSDATLAYRMIFSHLTDVLTGLPGFQQANPDDYDHAFDYRWRHNEDEPYTPLPEQLRGGSLKVSVEKALDDQKEEKA
jgi:hypothetical protein